MTTTKARRRRSGDVENDVYAAFCSRALRAAGRRVAGGDVEGLRDLVELQRDLDTALNTAVCGLREFGYSWAEIASRIGTTRQAAQQRWGTRNASATSGGLPGQGDLLALVDQQPDLDGQPVEELDDERERVAG